MRQVALILDEHSSLSPLIDYSVWWQERGAADYHCWIRDGQPSVQRVALTERQTGPAFDSARLDRVLDLRLKKINYIQSGFDPSITESLGSYVDVISLCRHQYNILRASMAAGAVALPQSPVLVPGGSPPPVSVVVHLNMDAVKAAVAMRELILTGNEIVLLAFNNEPSSSQKRIVQYAQSYFEKVGLTHAGGNLAPLMLNFLPPNSMFVASLRTPGHSSRVINDLLDMPDSSRLSFLLIY